MFIHAVYFWLRDGLTVDEQTQFSAGVESLLTIESVKHGWVGVAASTDRPIIDRSYARALVVVFADEAGHDAYQVHPTHDRFRDECHHLWTRVQIYDSVTTAPTQPASYRATLRVTTK